MENSGMRNMTLRKIAEAVRGELYMEQVPENMEADTAWAKGVVIDSRLVKAGYIFIATKGEHVDGHSFIEKVYEMGALGVICEKAPDAPKGAYILVKDSFQALEALAEYYRTQLSIKVVGITGSVGKTSTKEFIASVCSKGFRTLKTRGNYNNEVGLPLTVLRIRSDCEVAVLEMGISDFGEMHRLSKVAKPDICVITNIGQCHLENLGTRDGILKAKTEIFDFLDLHGRVCLNGDDDKLCTITSVHGRQPLFFGMDSKNAVYASDYQNKGLEGSAITIHCKEEAQESVFSAVIPLPGEHMVYNALAATAVGTLLGLTKEQIQEGIRDVQPVNGRDHVIHAGSITIIDDCYNANPVSMKAGIDLLAQAADSRKIAILGDMFELGVNEKELHAEVGAYAAQKGIDVIICVGTLCKCLYDGVKKAENTDCMAYYFEDKESMLEKVHELIGDGDTVLVKASHGMHFEEVIEKL